MRILITNDDGIDALGIRLLAEWAKKLGDVTIVAPKTEQSAKSHAIELIKPIEVLECSPLYGVEAYSVDSTPADCVRFGIIGMHRQYDLVLSGINRGQNMGKDIVYSGTVAAIFEAAGLNHRALAISTFADTLEGAAEHLDLAYEFVVKNKLFDYTPVFNINIPADAKGVKITRQGRSCFSDEFVPIGDNKYAQKGSFYPDSDRNDINIDAVAVDNGLISITPMQNDRTEHSVYERLKHL